MDDLHVNIKFVAICGNCGKECDGVTGSWRYDSMVCEECAWGASYKFIKKIQATNNLPLWKRRLLSLLPFTGYGCVSCGINYRFGTHDTTYNGRGSSGTAPLCNWCWRELPLTRKLSYYRKCHDEYAATMLPDGAVSVIGHCQFDGWTLEDLEAEWMRIEAAVTTEHYQTVRGESEHEAIKSGT